MSNFWGFSWFFMIFCKGRSVEHAEFVIHLGCRKPCFLQLLAHIYTKNHENVNEIMTFYHDFSDNFRSFAYLHNSWTVRAVFSQTGCFVFEEICIFSKNPPNIVTVSWIFFDIFLLFCVKNTKNMDFTEFEKGRCAA